MIKKLVLSDGTRERELHLVGRIVVGRDPACEISHDDSLLSRRHAEFVTTGNAVTVKDLGSRNGVFVNGTRASEQALEPGDIVQIGPLRARFIVDAAPRSLSPEALDVDRTAVIRKTPAPSPAPVPSVATVHPAVALAFEEVDEDATRLVPARAEQSASESSPLFTRPLDGAAEEEDEDITRFTPAPDIPAQRALDRPTPVAPPEPIPVRQHPVVQAPPTSSLGAFVYGQLTALALAIVSTAMIATAMWARSLGCEGSAPSSSLGWFALPVITAVAGIAVIGPAVNRRITRALTGNERAQT